MKMIMRGTSAVRALARRSSAAWRKASPRRVGSQLPGALLVVGDVALVHPQRARPAGQPVAQRIGVVVGAGAAGLAACEPDQRVVGIGEVDRVAQTGAELDRRVRQ